MKKKLYKLMTVCVLAMPFTAVAQSTDNMKQDQSQQDQMKHDDMSQDQSGKGDMSKDQSKKDDMSKDDMKGQEGQRAKKSKMKNAKVKNDDGMKQN